MQFVLEKRSPKQKRSVFDLSIIDRKDFIENFNLHFMQLFHEQAPAQNYEEQNQIINSAVDSAKEACFPLRSASRKHPWISSSTLELIEERNDARENYNVSREKLLNNGLMICYLTEIGSPSRNIERASSL